MILMKDTNGVLVRQWLDGEYVEIDISTGIADVGIFTQTGCLTGSVKFVDADKMLFINVITGLTFTINNKKQITYGRL